MTTNLRTLDSNLHQLLFAHQPALLDNVSRKRQLLYRSLVRNGIVDTICESLELTHQLAGAKQLQRWIEEWLDAQGPQTHLFWQLPVDFACWLMQQPPCDNRPRIYVELAHYEAMQVDALNALDASWQSTQQRPHITATCHIVCHPSARLGIYKYPVFDMDNTMQTLPTKGVQPVFVVIYRRQESCRFLQCDPHMAQLLAQLQNNSCLQTGFAFLRGLYGQV
ncbi:MAG: putative DNA-binding domain-containing protein, partial [Myxococcota bacterium]